VLLVVQLLRPEDRLVAPHDCYGGTSRLLDSLGRAWALPGGIHRRESPEALTEALSRPTRMLWVETPSNPLLRITDLRLAKHAGTPARTRCWWWTTPSSPLPCSAAHARCGHRGPLDTKYLNGHSDVVGGAVVAREQALAETAGLVG
jgi:cystathionine gamma-synthase